MAELIPGRALAIQAGRITTAPLPEQHSGAGHSLYAQLCSWENLLLAYQCASRGKRGKPKVAGFEHRLEDELFKLQDELLTKTYRPGSYCNFHIHEPKRRLISAAPFRDRVVHHALCNIIEPIFEHTFIDDSYANRLGKGNHRALDRAQFFARRNRYVLQCDIRQFFPSIDHQILREHLAVKVHDHEMRWLIDQILDGGQPVLMEEYDMVYFPRDDLFAINRPRGLPIGNLTSQFWANVYLNSFDHFVKRTLQCQSYLRFVDDMLLFANDKKSLWHWKDQVVAYLAKLRLTIHPGAHPRPVTEGIPWLGFIIFPEQRRLKQRKGIYFQRRLHSMKKDFVLGEVSLTKLTASIGGWINHVRYGNTVGLRKAVLNS